MIKKKITVKFNSKDLGIRNVSHTPIISTESSIRKQKLNTNFYSVSPAQNLKDSSIKKRKKSAYNCLYFKENYMKNYTKLSPVLNNITFTTPDDLSIESPFCTSFSLKSTAHCNQSKEVKSIITRIAKFNILEMKKQSLQERLNDKYRRFNLRQRKTVKFIKEIIEIKKTWIVFEYLLGIPFLVKNLVENRKRLKIRSRKRMIWFKDVCLCIGKILILIKKIRVKRAFRKITLLIKYARIWLVKTRKKKRDTIVYLIENSLNFSIYLKLYAFWNMRILKIQRWMRKQLKIREFLYQDLLKLWAKKEVEIFRSIGGKTNPFSGSMLRVSIVPESKKLQLIRAKVKEITKNYNLLKINYNYMLDKFNDRLRSFIFQTESPLEVKPIKPKVPNIRKIFIKTDVLKELIHNALSERSALRSRRK